MLGVGVNGHRTAEFCPHELGNDGHSRRATHEQNRVELLRRDLRRLEGALERRDRAVHRWPYHRLQLGPGQPDVRGQVGQQDGDGHVGVRGQGLLRRDALVPQAGDGVDHTGVFLVKLGELRAERPAHVTKNGRVEVDAAEALDPLRSAQDLEPDRRLAQHGRVEGAAAQVEDGDDRSRIDSLLLGVKDRCRLGLGRERHRLVEPGQAYRLEQQVGLVRAPVRRVRNVRRRGLATLAPSHLVDNSTKQLSEERLGGVWRAA